MLGTLRNELAHWRDTLSAHFDPAQPPVVGWQLPFLGCGLNFGLGGPRWLDEQHRRLGSPFTLYVKGHRFTISQDPDFMRHFYTAGLDDVSFFAGLQTFPGIGELIPLGLSGPEGQNVGIEVLRLFLPVKVSSSAADLDEEAGRSLNQSLASGQGDLLTIARLTVMRITALLIVGPRLTHDPAFMNALCSFDDAMLRLVASLLDRRPIQQGLVARSRAVAAILAELRRRRQEPSGKDPRDVADAMLSARRPSGEPLTDEVIAMELFGYLFATAANTPAAAAMCLLHVLTDPTLQRRIVDEQSACQKAHGEVISMPALREMPLLNACYQETLRLYAPAMHVRMTLKPLQVGKYTLPARSMIAFSPYLLHRDPSVYTDPEVFDPERFRHGPRGPAKGPSTEHYLPYGRGVHTCLGRNLARQEIMLCVARLLRDFEVSLSPGKDPLAVTWVTNGIAAPTGPRTIRVQRRSVGLPADLS